METRLYHQAILAAAAAGAGRGAIDSPDARVSLDNPLCGDRIRIDITIRQGRLHRVAHDVRGCLLCEAAASVIGAEAPGQRVVMLRKVVASLRAGLEDDAASAPLPWPALEMFAPVRNFKSRHECVLLPFDALIQALDQACAKFRDPPGQ